MRRVTLPKSQIMTSFNRSKLYARQLMMQNSDKMPTTSLLPSKFLRGSGGLGTEQRHRNPILKVLNLTDILDCYEQNLIRQQQFKGNQGGPKQHLFPSTM